ncbi:hypothetical protein [Actinoplanes sp. NPDC023714]|uniref:hypothetical protein n=1 Tax=Actinoplanes sp. NPDC023714 TaxID=3154322 RepID=UPI0033F52CE3
MTDHWDDFDFDDDHHDVPDVPDVPDDHHADLDFDDYGQQDFHSVVDDQPELPDENDISDMSEMSADDLFPPALDLGDLPEPVDGFPWIDTATLGTPDPVGFTAPLDPVTPDELAAYAHTGQPADWSALAASDDPATSALARWWTPDEQ